MAKHCALVEMHVPALHGIQRHIEKIDYVHPFHVGRVAKVTEMLPCPGALRCRFAFYPTRPLYSGSAGVRSGGASSADRLIRFM